MTKMAKIDTPFKTTEKQYPLGPHINPRASVLLYKLTQFLLRIHHIRFIASLADVLRLVTRSWKRTP